MAFSPATMADQPVEVTFAHRCPGRFWSIEQLFADVSAEFPDSVRVTHQTAPRNRANASSVLANLRWASRLPDCDVVHQTGDIHYAVLGVRRHPVVLTIHDLRFIEQANGLKRRLLKWLWLQWPCQRADRVTVISQFTKDRLIAHYPAARDKVRVIPNCVAPDFVAVSKGWPSGRPQLLQVGTTDNKNLPRVVEACAGLPIKLCILGKLSPVQREQLDRSGLDYESYADLAKHQVVELYAASDLVIFVSTYEGFGLPILEAQATGRPVLTSSLSPMKVVAGDGALFVDPLCVEAIRAGLVRLLHDAALRETLTAAGFRNVRQYSAASVALRYAYLYRELVPR